uniref:Uncharacterized protein n=1 Tax=Octopus bimaculoides TaxID=37653 RepID=A0A0L8HTG0_OCTBM
MKYESFGIVKCSDFKWQPKLTREMLLHRTITILILLYLN